MECADRLTERLTLERQPVALAFVEAPPASVEEFEGDVPSACSFWARAEAGVFYASAEKHFNCAIGAMTMGFDLPESVMSALQGVVTQMCADGYISPDEPPAIPTEGRPKAGIVYGPLRSFPLAPDLVLLWLRPEQAMVFSEAAGTADWSTDDQPVALGRPTCAALPAALAKNHGTMSLGCMGMRTYTGVPASLLLAALPGSQAGAFLEALDRAGDANEKMRGYYEAQKERFAGVA